MATLENKLTKEMNLSMKQAGLPSSKDHMIFKNVRRPQSKPSMLNGMAGYNPSISNTTSNA